MQTRTIATLRWRVYCGPDGGPGRSGRDVDPHLRPTYKPILAANNKLRFTEAKEGFVSRFFVESGTEISADGTQSVVVQFRMFDNVYLEGERDVYEDVNFGIVYRIRFK